MQPEQPLANYNIHDNFIIDAIPRMYGGGGIDCRDPENIDVLKDRFTSTAIICKYIWFPLTLDIGAPTLWDHIRSLSDVAETWWDAGGIFACPDTDSFSARCQNREGHSPLAIHTAAFVHVLVLLAAGFALALGRVIT
jgi:hypothetical protein